MVVLDSLAEEGGVDSEVGSVVRVTPATSVEGPDTGPWTAKDQVIDSDAYSEINTCSICLHEKTKETDPFIVSCAKFL